MIWGRKKKRAKAAGMAFINKVYERMTELRMEYREPAQLHVTRRCLRGCVSYGPEPEPNLYVHPSDWANVEAAAKDFPEPARSWALKGVTMLWGLPVVRDD